jgi:poly(beta-D-mannuronate) lyase
MASEIIDLSNWYLTLPIGEPLAPLCIHQLGGYCHNEFFYAAHTKKAVVFKANCGGVTTKGSTYPRSELREKINGKLAAWSSLTGTHVMELIVSIHKVPAVKPEVVIAQIHDANSDVIEIKLSSKSKNKLYVHTDNENFDLDSNYNMGNEFTLKILVKEGLAHIYFNGEDTAKHSIPINSEGNYFKAGNYVQSNCSKGDHHDDYAEVWIHSLKVTHS